MVVIAIDGPAGVGKSTVGKRVAEELGFKYLDSGALYRALAYKMIKEGVELDSPNFCSLLHTLSLEVEDGVVYLDGEDVTERIRGEDVEKVISKIAAEPKVREAFCKWQRRFAKGKNVVVEGRDIGTVVFADAFMKFYMDASIQVRAKRRYLQLYNIGKRKKFEEVLHSLSLRDKADEEREVAPLRKAKDALYIDTSRMKAEEVVEKIVKAVQKKMASKSFAYTAAQAFLWALFRILFRIQVQGVQNLPREGPLLICANHASYLDPIVLAVCIPRKVSFVAKSELFSVPLLRGIIKKFDAFPIRREGFSRSGITLALKRMEQGKALIIFPEGTRSKDGRVGEGKRGAGYIAVHAQREYKAVVIPARIKGTERILPPSRFLPIPSKLKIIFGSPLFCADKEPQECASLIMKSICAL
jgi:cytidylate kinase